MGADAAFPSLPAPAWPGKLTRFGGWTIALGTLLLAVSGSLYRFAALGPRIALLLFAGGGRLGPDR